MRKNFRSDISIRESFYDYDQSGERIQSLVPENVRIEYFTPAYPRVRLVCSRYGDTFHNCSLSENGRVLVCNLALSRKSLGVGPLLKIVKNSVADSSFPYDFKNKEHIASTGIDLWGGPSDAGELESESVLSEVILRYGYSAYRLAVLDGFEGTEQEWLESLIGDEGKSAYQVAVDNGFEGTVAEWLASLVGAPGKSAYQVAVDNGFEGTEQEWLESLIGDEGKSAYQVAVDNGFEGTVAEWLASLDGSDGTGIDEVEQTETSIANGGTNKVRITLTDGTYYDIQIKNGSSSNGLFPTSSALAAACPSPKVGDFAFVGDGFPADIYVCETAGTWTDSGEDFDGGSVDLTDYAKKAELSQLEAKVNGIPAGTWETMDLSVVDRQNIFISGETNKWDAAAGWYSKFLPIEPGKTYRVTAGAGGVTRYSFMTSNAYTQRTTVTTYATGYSGTIRVETGETTGDLVAPENANYLYLLTEIGNGPTGVSVSEYHEEREGGLVNDTKDLQDNMLAVKSSLSGYETVDAGLASVPAANIFINGNSNKWEQVAGWYSKFLPVQQGKKYRVTAGSGGVTRYAFLTANTYTPNTIVSTYATGYDSSIRVNSGESTNELQVPENAQYLWVLTALGDSVDTGVSISKTQKGGDIVDVVNELAEIREDISQISLSASAGIIVNEGVENNGGVYASLQDAVDSIEDAGTIIIEGDLHISDTVSIPAGKTVKLTGGGLKGSMQSLGVRRKDTNGVAKVYIGDLKPQWIEVDGVAKYPASSLRDYPYKAAVTSSGASNATVTVTITVPVADALKLAAKGTTDVWITLLVEWMSAKLRIDSIDTSTGVITCTFNQGVGSYHNWSGTKRIIVENIDIESATINGDEDTWAEGTFYYSGGYLYYKYNASESAPNIEIPAVETLISANGSLYMDGVEVSVTSHNFDNLMGEGDGHGYRSFQSGFVMNGAIEVNGQAEIRNCKFRHTTNNAIRVNSNASGVNIVNCDFNEVGCDAILVGECDYINYNKGTAQSYVPSSAPSNVTIKGNSIHHPGRVYQEASAIAVAYGTDFYVGSNVISDTYYTGISTGADWAATSTQINEGGIIEGNLFKNIGVGSCALSDGAAIYNLGNERGMVVTKNIITGIFGGKKGGQNLYAVFFDQGSKNITFSNNIAYDVYGFTSINISGSGSGILVKNNIFALPKSVVADQNENLPSCFVNNIFAWSSSKTISQITTGTYVKNLYYRYDSALSSISFDTQAVIGNPGFRDADNYDFGIVDDTYTSQISFVPFVLKMPTAKLVNAAKNSQEDEIKLQEWLTRWDNGTL